LAGRGLQELAKRQGCALDEEAPDAQADPALCSDRRRHAIVRARIKIGLQNFVYNIRRLATLERRKSDASFTWTGRLAAS
jgi:hypothetical protein